MDIIRRDNISYKEFIEEHYKPGIPLVFKSASKVWKANGLFTPDGFGNIILNVLPIAVG